MPFLSHLSDILLAKRQ
uniref:Uncharacterized protein n=1 Tax=Anguilla anguilla TaxID=7936 RepID=A0A0E9QLT7_ANGAN